MKAHLLAASLLILSGTLAFADALPRPKLVGTGSSD